MQGVDKLGIRAFKGLRVLTGLGFLAHRGVVCFLTEVGSSNDVGLAHLKGLSLQFRGFGSAVHLQIQATA